MKMMTWLLMVMVVASSTRTYGSSPRLPGDDGDEDDDLVGDDVDVNGNQF